MFINSSIYLLQKCVMWLQFLICHYLLKNVNVINDDLFIEKYMW